MIIVTSNDVPGARIEHTFGECFGLTVRSRNEALARLAAEAEVSDVSGVVGRDRD